MKCTIDNVAISLGRIYRSKSRIVTFYILHTAFFISGALAQSPYQLKTGREIVLLGVGAATYGGSILVEHSIEPLTQSEIDALNPESVWAFDRKATVQWSTRAPRASDITLAGNLALAGGITLGTKSMRQDVVTIGVMFAETMLLTNGIKGIVKGVTQRVRPFVYYPVPPLSKKMDVDAKQSFFSGHAANAFAAAVFTGEVFRHYYPNSRLKPYVWVSSLGLATATSALRYHAGLHYPTDLIAGAAFGTLVGWGIPKIHEVKNQSRLGKRLDIQPWSNGSANGIYVQLMVFSR